MSDPFGGGFGGFDPRMFENVPLFRELAKVMSWTGGPVNWELASQTAESLAGDDEPPTGGREADELAATVVTAELWLDAVTDLPAIEGPVQALSKVEWVRRATSSDGLGIYVEPMARGMGTALGRNLPEELSGLAGGMGGADNPLSQAMGAMGAMLYGMQVGTIAGHLAGQLLGTYDLGVPTLDPRTVGSVGGTAHRFATDYEFEPMEFRHWLALSEAAHRRQYAGVGWLRGHVAELIEQFASGADFDPSGLFDQLGGLGIDPQDPASLQRALEQPDAFRLEASGAQQEVLDRLQALVAFTQAWVDTVIRAAAADKLPALPRIEEAMHRRRAEHGPGQRFLAQLVGLDLTPSDIRQAHRFCEAVVTARGQEGLDRAWRDATHLPSPAELGEPSRWLVRMAAAELTDPER